MATVAQARVPLATMHGRILALPPQSWSPGVQWVRLQVKVQSLPMAVARSRALRAGTAGGPFLRAPVGGGVKDAPAIHLSSGILPGIQKDSPFDDLGFNENTAMDPRIVTEQLRGLRLAASPHDNECPAAVRVGTGHDN